MFFSTSKCTETSFQSDPAGETPDAPAPPDLQVDWDLEDGHSDTIADTLSHYQGVEPRLR